jgi:hypothetical protein
MTQPALWKLAPAPVTKPWGLVHDSAVRMTGIRAGVGELWLASAQTGPGNCSTTVLEPNLRRTLAQILADAGEDELTALLGPTPLAHLREHPYRGKTEAWYIRAAVGRVGVVAGPRNQADADRLKQIITTDGLDPHPQDWSDEVRELFGVLDFLRGGEMFLTPAGALHTMFAVGPESILIIDEIQQGYGQALMPTLSKILMVQDSLLSVQVHPSDETVADATAGRFAIEQNLQENPTVRVYDFGRRPGVYPERGFQLTRPENGLRRVTPIRLATQDGCTREIMVADPHFVKARLEIEAGTTADLGPRYGSYRVLHCIAGKALLMAGPERMMIARGETIFVPAALEDVVRIQAETDCTVFDDSLPDLDALRAYLTAHGAGDRQIGALFNPPSARE